MELILQHGRPADTEGRLPREIRVYDYLDKLGIEYERLDHEAAFTMEACEDFAEVLGIEDCKNLFLCNRQQTDFYLLMMPGNKPFKTKEITKQIGSPRAASGGRRCAGASFCGMPSLREYRQPEAEDGGCVRDLCPRHRARLSRRASHRRVRGYHERREPGL